MIVLYKYVSADRVLTCLPEAGNGTLRATQPSALNDPFECSAQLIVNEEKDLQRILTSLNPETPVYEHTMNAAIRKWGTLFWQELLRQQLSQRFGIVSFASDAWDPLLWAYYSKDGSGFVIGYTIDSLNKLVDEDPETFRPVEYTSQPPRIPNSSLLNFQVVIQSLLLNKSIVWDHEREWRLIKLLRNTTGIGSNDDKNVSINLITIPNSAVVEVYYTERTPKNIVETIERRLHEKNNRFGVDKATKLRLADSSYSYQPTPSNPFTTLSDILSRQDDPSRK